ncbi:MAG: LD-carboxypeptidase, partial [Synechococcus sp. MOX_bin13]|nr:LD-carboxypeptidase [Synechococcus sp. MOX_bin13]
MRITPAPPLRTGDRVTCVAASSALQDDIKLQEGIAVLQSWGLDVQPQTLASRRWGYFAGRDDTRHADLHPAEPAALLA